MGVGATPDVHSSSVGNHRGDFSTKWPFPMYESEQKTMRYDLYPILLINSK